MAALEKDDLIGGERSSVIDSEPELQSDDYRDHLYPKDDPRLDRFRGLDARQYAVSRAASPVLSSVVEEWQELYQAPFAGLTAGDGVIPGLYQGPVLPGEEAPVERIVTSANALFALVGPTTAERIRDAVDSRRWRAWSNPEFIIHDIGVRLEDLEDEGRAAVADLVTASLGDRGAGIVFDLMELNHRLGELVGLENAMNRYSYHFSVYGDPSLTEPWGWQLFGHHMAVNVVVHGTALRVGPVFLGAEPNRFGDEDDSRIMFASRQERALAFITSLDDAQLAVARRYETVRSTELPEGRLHVLDERIVGGAFHDNEVVPYEGIRAAELSTGQQQLLLALIEDCLEPLPAGPMRGRMREVAAYLHETRVSWIGGMDARHPFYFRIQSPVLFAEFDHHAGIWLANQFPAPFHIHTVLRNPNAGDYGGLLKAEPDQLPRARAARTVQLRRYRVEPELFDDFLAWWRTTIVPLREGAGFRLEGAFADREHHEFVWTVSVPGDRRRFTELERAYLDSPARAEAFKNVPDWVPESTVSFVDDLLESVK